MAGICQEEKRRSVWSHSYLLHNIKFVFFPTHFFPSMKKKNNFLSFFVECLGYIQENCSVIGPTHLVFLDGIKNICWISFAILCCNMYKPGISEWNQTSALDIWDVKLKTLATNYLDVLMCLMSSNSDIKFMNFTPLGLTVWIGISRYRKMLRYYNDLYDNAR